MIFDIFGDLFDVASAFDTCSFFLESRIHMFVQEPTYWSGLYRALAIIYCVYLVLGLYDLRRCLWDSKGENRLACFCFLTNKRDYSPKKQLGTFVVVVVVVVTAVFLYLH